MGLRTQIMEILFIDDDGKLIHATDDIFIPIKGDIIYIKFGYYRVAERVIDYPKGVINIELEDLK